MIYKSILCSLMLVGSISCLAETTKYCEDRKPYTEARKNDPTCHSISNELESNGVLGKPITIGKGGTAGGGGCGSNSACGENHHTAPSADSAEDLQPILPFSSASSDRKINGPYGFGNGGFDSHQFRENQKQSMPFSGRGR